MYRLRDRWEDGTPQGAVRVVEALGETPAATREVWRYLFGIDLKRNASRDRGSGVPAVGPAGSASSIRGGCI